MSVSISWMSGENVERRGYFQHRQAAEHSCLSSFLPHPLAITSDVEHLTLEDKHCRKNGQQTSPLDPLSIPP